MSRLRRRAAGRAAASRPTDADQTCAACTRSIEDPVRLPRAAARRGRRRPGRVGDGLARRPARCSATPPWPWTRPTSRACAARAARHLPRRACDATVAALEAAGRHARRRGRSATTRSRRWSPRSPRCDAREVIILTRPHVVARVLPRRLDLAGPPQARRAGAAPARARELRRAGRRGRRHLRVLRWHSSAAARVHPRTHRPVLGVVGLRGPRAAPSRASTGSWTSEEFAGAMTERVHPLGELDLGAGRR